VVQVALTSQQEHKEALLSLPQELAPLPAPALSTSPSPNQSTNRKPLAPPKDQLKVHREVQTTRKITRNPRADTKKALSNTRSKGALRVSKSNNSFLTSRTCSRWTKLRFRSYLLMFYLCTVQISQHKLELEVHQLMLWVVSKHSLVLYKEEVEEHQQQEEQEEAEEVAFKEATVVEAVVLKALIEVGVVATQTIIAIPSIREALNYNNNQTYLASW
jgi:hypothetical protein